MIAISRRRDVVVLVLSLAGHLGGALMLGRTIASSKTRHPPTEITLDVARPPAPTPQPVEPSPPAVAPRRVHRHTAAAAPPSREKTSPPPSAEPPPLDLTGVTLTDGTSGSAWASAVGNGAAMRGPVGPVAAVRPAGAGTNVGAAEQLVIASDLKRPPEPPPLQAELERQYPPDARRAGRTGEARLRARVRSDGGLDRIRVIAATIPSFGEACQRVLRPSRWTPPLDRAGNACATEITYVCRFEAIQ